MNKVEWISVHDRLPEEEAKVLVCIDWERIETAYLYLNTWYDWATNSPVIGGHVSHWAELPKLPQEE